MDWSCGKNKMILVGEEHRKPITEYRKPSGRTDNLSSSQTCLDRLEHRKPITEYRKPSGRMDNLRSSQNC